LLFVEVEATVYGGINVIIVGVPFFFFLDVSPPFQ
jgi:hypothetical protein